MSISDVSTGGLIKADGTDSAPGINTLIAHINSAETNIASKLPLSGGTMTGAITMATGYTPSADLNVATKSYADSSTNMPIILDKTIDYALNTFYQNSTNKLMFVTVTLHNKVSSSDTAYIKYYYYNNPSYSIILATHTLASGEYFSYTFLCPKDHWFGFYCDSSKTELYTICTSTIGN